MTDWPHPQVSGIPDGSRSAQRLKARGEGPAEWLGRRLTWLPSLLVSWIVANIGALLVAAGMIGLGFFTTKVLLSVQAIVNADEWLPRWLEGHRTPFLTDASYVASNMAHAPVLIPLVGVVALLLVLRGRWRMASFPVQAGLAEALAYALTVLFVVRIRPPVEQLDTFMMTHSFPSGHVAASVAVYGSLALLLTAHVRAMWVRVPIWTIAVVIPLVVAWSRLYRGEHHPIDVAAGALMGLGALTAALFAARTARVVAELRAGKRAGRELLLTAPSPAEGQS
jgi:membrane-associated phospholipid phosphatase